MRTAAAADRQAQYDAHIANLVAGFPDDLSDDHADHIAGILVKERDGN